MSLLLKTKFKNLSVELFTKSVAQAKTIDRALTILKITHCKRNRLLFLIYSIENSISLVHLHPTTLTKLTFEEIKRELIEVNHKTRNRSKAKETTERKLLIDQPRYILKDANRADRKINFANDLTKEFIAHKIRNGCEYCGETEIKMTLDRIDNSIGHLMSNVKAACLRCNLIRRDMPYEAWVKLIPSIRQTRESGLFLNWKLPRLGGGPRLGLPTNVP